MYQLLTEDDDGVWTKEKGSITETMFETSSDSLVIGDTYVSFTPQFMRCGDTYTFFFSKEEVGDFIAKLQKTYEKMDDTKPWDNAEVQEDFDLSGEEDCKIL